MPKISNKVLVSSKSGSSPGAPQELALCEAILALGRLDVNTDVRDRARLESGLIHLTIGLQHDKDAMDPAPVIGMDNKLVGQANNKEEEEEEGKRSNWICHVLSSRRLDTRQKDTVGV